MDRFLRPSVFAAVVGTLIGLSYPEVLLGVKSFVLRDYGIFGYPLAVHQKTALLQGELPLWNPLNCAGIPFLAQWNTMVFYPGAIIYLLLPMPWSHGAFMFAHQFAAALGMYLLARRWTGNLWGSAGAGVVFGFNGLILNALMWPNNMAALGLMPWVVMAVDRMASPATGEAGHAFGRIAMAALMAAGQLFTGAPEIIGFTWVICFFAVAARVVPRELPAAFGKLALVLGLTLLLGAIQLLPFLELLAHSQRSSAFARAHWSMPLWGWANFLAPLFRFYRSPQGVFFQMGQEWTSSYYFSIAALAVIPIAITRDRARWCWLILIAGSLLLALGPAGKAWAMLKSALPLLGFIRFPVKFVVPAIFGIAILTAWGFSEVAKRSADPGEQRRTRTVLWSITAVLALGALGIAAYSNVRPTAYEQPSAILVNAVVRVFMLSAFASVLFLILRGDPRTWLKPAAVVILATDLLTHAPRQNTVAKSSVYAGGLSREGPLSELAHGGGRAFQTRAAHDRFYFEMRTDPRVDYTGRRLGLYGNCNLLDQIPSVDGFYSLYLPWQRQLWQRLFLAPTNQFPTGLARLMGVAAMSSPASPVEWVKPEFPALPILSAGQEIRATSTNEVIGFLADPAFDPSATLFVADGVLAERPKVETSIDQMSVNAHRLSARVQADAPTVVLMTQTWHPAWEASINGEVTPIVRANHAFQAIAIPGGTSQVEFRYVDRQFRKGAAASAAGLLVCGMLLVFGWRRRRVI